MLQDGSQHAPQAGPEAQLFSVQGHAHAPHAHCGALVSQRPAAPQFAENLQEAMVACGWGVKMMATMMMVVVAVVVKVSNEDECEA